MKATLGISLSTYLYLKLEKMLSFLLSPMFSLQQNWRRRDLCPEAVRVGGKQCIQM
jgi:hypothetical protein